MKYLRQDSENVVLNIYNDTERKVLARNIDVGLDNILYAFDMRANFNPQGIAVIEAFLDDCRKLANNIKNYKPAPKFKFGDAVIYKGRKAVVIQVFSNNTYGVMCEGDMIPIFCKQEELG